MVLTNVGVEFIAALFFVSVLLLGICLVVVVHFNGSRHFGSDDILTRYIKDREKELKECGRPISFEVYMLMHLLFPLLLGGAAMALSGKWPLMLAMAIVGIRIPRVILKIYHMQMGKKFEERYGKSLELLGTELKSGKSIIQAVDTVANSPWLHNSLRSAYEQMNTDLKIGMPISDAFKKFAEETGSRDAMDLYVAITVQNSVGMHEGDVVSRQAEIIKNRRMVKKEVEAILTATVTMIEILGIMCPLGMVGFLFSNRNYMEIYFSSGRNIAVLVILFACTFIGTAIDNRIVNKIRKGNLL